jgi:hypothetical protein
MGEPISFRPVRTEAGGRPRTVYRMGASPTLIQIILTMLPGRILEDGWSGRRGCDQV